MIAQVVKWFIVGFMFFVGIVGFWEINFKKQCTAKEFYEKRRDQ